jgi:hypothetical protein
VKAAAVGAYPALPLTQDAHQGAPLLLGLVLLLLLLDLLLLLQLLLVCRPVVPLAHTADKVGGAHKRNKLSTNAQSLCHKQSRTLFVMMTASAAAFYVSPSSLTTCQVSTYN